MTNQGVPENGMYLQDLVMNVGQAMMCAGSSIVP